MRPTSTAPTSSCRRWSAAGRSRTSWADPDEGYEAHARRFAAGLVERPPEGFEAFAARLAVEGRRAALGQLALKLDLIRRALALRARRPEPFAGAYDPVDAGSGVCAYVRGGEVLAVVPVR